MRPVRSSAEALFLATMVLLAGCAHAIKVSPDVGRLEVVSASPRVQARVAYYIPPEVSSVEITTAGGGGDNVRYFPYQDIELGFAKMLSNVFTDVVKLNSMAELPSLSLSGTNLIIQPVIVTSSGGSGLVTWPPTNFTVDLTCNIRNPTGALIASPRVVGTGSAETGERIRDHGIAGRRAMEDALIKMQASLRETRLDGSVPTGLGTALPSSTNSIAARLSQLKELREKELISQEEYEARRKAILDSL
jgi:hypothetical protein